MKKFLKKAKAITIMVTIFLLFPVFSIAHMVTVGFSAGING